MEKKMKEAKEAYEKQTGKKIEDENVDKQATKDTEGLADLGLSDGEECGVVEDVRENQNVDEETKAELELAE